MIQKAKKHVLDSIVKIDGKEYVSVEDAMEAVDIMQKEMGVAFNSLFREGCFTEMCFNFDPMKGNKLNITITGRP